MSPCWKTELVVALAALLFTATSCETSLSRDNPYDPDLPAHEREPASVSGIVSLEFG